MSTLMMSAAHVICTSIAACQGNKVGTLDHLHHWVMAKPWLSAAKFPVRIDRCLKFWIGGWFELRKLCKDVVGAAKVSRTFSEQWHTLMSKKQVVEPAGCN